MLSKSARKTDGRFYLAIENSAKASRIAPLNTNMIQHNADVSLRKVNGLLAYQRYLAQARTFKATRKGVSISFEREVQAQARQALKDARELCGASLRTTKHLRNSGLLEEVMNSWKEGVKASGPVRIHDVWDDVMVDTNARETLQAQGMTDELLSLIGEQFKRFESTVKLREGKLAMEVRFSPQEDPREVIFAQPHQGRPRTVTELLAKGRFDTIAEAFNTPGAISLDVAPAQDQSELDVSEAILTGTVLIMQELAHHVRKLGDTRLAVYQGNDPASVIIGVVVAGLVLVAVGSALSAVCADDPDSAACTWGKILIVLGVILIVGVAILGLCGEGGDQCAYTIIIAATGIAGGLLEGKRKPIGSS